eukprot:11408010-Alexandrium_andersonii.AAC.1
MQILVVATDSERVSMCLLLGTCRHEPSWPNRQCGGRPAHSRRWHGNESCLYLCACRVPVGTGRSRARATQDKSWV